MVSILGADTMRAMEEPKRLGRYEVVGTLGKGAMGVVYEGLDPKLHRKVAIKTILKSVLDPETAKNYSMRFTREAQAVARLNHPNIVQVHDFGEEGDIAYIVMEFIKGKELKEHFDANKSFSIDEAVRIMCELCEALHFAHEAGVIHRDIKPANVMIDSEGRVKLADFGVARISADADRTQAERTQAGTMIGTPAYMSPEQISGGPVDRRSDIFSAGIILYQFLTGEKAFTGSGAWTIARKIIQETPPLPSSINSSISPDFDRVANRALAKKTAHRYQTARELGSDLRRALEGKAVADQGEPAAAVAPPASPAVAAGAAPAAAPGSQEVELEFWRAIKDGEDPDDFELYVRQFPGGIYAELAKRKIAKLRGIAPTDPGQKSPAQEKRELEEAARREAEARARLAEEKAQLEAAMAQRELEFSKREAEAEARRQAETRAQVEGIERARKEAEANLAKREAQDRARREAEDKARRVAEEKARREAEVRAKHEADERAKREAEFARREAELKSRLATSAPRKSPVVAVVIAGIVLAAGAGTVFWMRPDNSADAKRMAELVAQLNEYKQREAELKLSREKGDQLDREAAQARQREEEMQKQAGAIRQREAEAKKAGDLAKQRELAELAAQREAEARKQAELSQQREAEAKKQAELTRQREAEAKKQAEQARQQQAELQKLQAEQRKFDEAKKAAERATADKAAQAKAAEAARQAEAQKQAGAERQARAAEADRQAAAERAAAEQRAAAERAAQAKAAAEKTAAERAAAEKAAAEKVAAEKTQVAVAAPAPAPAAGGPEALFKQASALEGEGRIPEAVRVYIQAARGGNGQAAKRLGDIYAKGAPGVPLDTAESLKWYTLARARGVDVSR
jgi:tRNA A-37 threonylcarbamoyl transferase component Bud32